ncbi:AAA family ATPase [Sinirhodobacter sp. WL0062]|uniref:AAA family ATPase n=1 Tax=Rhodobacter flavimaris TaxID=2907145 RepID=A0ABS8YRN9_9RHOB|nr:adenylate/guanylate cyclase domain-containing protein [Sinirhodobacter sp. WL0062]MCE5972547.1 AAA family ATPase [Sinirhodobacter sp. WL0062]
MNHEAGADIGEWLTGLGLAQYAEAFRTNDIDASILPQLTSDDLREIGVASVGHRRRMLSSIEAMGGKAPEAERRLLTVLFCDLVDSTSLAAASDPEDYIDFISLFRRALEAAIRPLGGYVAKFLGDGVMATFGYPSASEHDAERAVAAGLAALERVAKLPPLAGRQVQARIGIATGLTVVGANDAGAGLLDDSAIGETPNLAARLQTLAQPGTIVISAQTRDLIGKVFDCADLGPHRLKGIAEPVPVWQVIGRNMRTSRFDALRSNRGSSIFVGRAVELARLSAALRDKRGQTLVVTGESGIGKSRLARRAVSAVCPEERRAMIIQCSPYGVDVPFEPIRYLLEAACQLRADDDREQSREKIVAFLSPYLDPEDERVALLCMLLGRQPQSDGPLAAMGGPEIRNRLMALLGQLLVAMSAPSAHVIVEDAQWLDPSSADLIERNREALANAGTALVVTAGTGPRKSWLEAPQAEVIALERLNSAEVTELVRAVAADRPISDEALATIVARSDGVPTYAEELARGYFEAASAEGSAPENVPVSLSQALQARLDRLTQGRRVACLGAAIGREFPISLLVAVTDMPAETARSAIDELIEAEVLIPGKSAYGDVVRFQHTLVREAAYDLLLKRQRPALHARIAEVLTTQFPEIADKQPHIMAMQYANAGAHVLSASEWLRAGRRAFQRSAYAEASAFFSKALAEITLAEPSPQRDSDELEIRLSLLSAMICVSGYQSLGASEQTEHAIRLSKQLGDTGKLIPALQARWVHLGSGNEWRPALQLARQAHEVAAKGSDIDRLVAHRMCATSHLFVGEIDEALHHYLAFMTLFDPDQHGEMMRQGHSDHVTMVMLGLSEAYLLKGDIANADLWRDRMFAYARTMRRVHDSGHMLVFVSMHSELLGRHDLTKAYIAELEALMTQHSLPNWGGYRDLFVGLLRAREGGVDEGLAKAREGVERLIAVKAFGNWWYLLYAEACAKAGRWREVAWALDRARAISEGGDVRFAAELYRLDAHLAFECNCDADAARALMEQGLRIARGQSGDLVAARLERDLAKFAVGPTF